MAGSQNPPTELKWIEEPSVATLTPPSEEFELVDRRTFSNTILKKSKENPFVPLGLAATTMCLTMGLINMKRGNSAKQQIYMRGRIGFQFFTLAAMTIGVLLTARQRNKNS